MCSGNENLFAASCDGCLKQINIKSKRIIKDYFKITQGGGYTMSITPDNKWLFLSDNKGYLTQI